MSSAQAEWNDEIIVGGSPPPSMSKVTIVKNLVMICTSFLLCFTAFFGARNLQTSLYPEDNVGHNSLVIASIAAMGSNLLLASLLVHKLGLRLSLVVCLLLFVAYPLYNFYPTRYTIYVGATLAGAGIGPMWIAQSTYLALLGEKYAAFSGEPPDVAISFFFGVFYLVYRGSMFTGNVISSIVFRKPPSIQVLSDDDAIVIRSLCGAHYCYEDLNVAFGRDAINASANNSDVHTIYHPTTSQINLLFGVYTLCALLAIPLGAMIDPINTSGEQKSAKVVDTLLSTMRQMRDRKEIALIPLSIISGITFAFITADYSVAFITCSIGIDNIGYVTAFFGGAAGLGSVALAPLLKYLGRKSIFMIGGLSNAAALVGMLTWPPGTHSMVVLCVFAGLWGFANAVWTSQVVSFIAVLFHEDAKNASFTCNFFWQMVALSVWHATSTHVCLHVQLYVIAGILTVAMAGYAAIELMLGAEEAKQCSQTQIKKIKQPVFIVEKFAYFNAESLDKETCS